ncbi:ABC transporter ATP-binding protein [Leifsonella bigeumensis]|uniref:ABC transporter ATP-binding protein n=1 Tax=Leifsonella bigeumensis TaxID=433643 RepID=UPI0031DB1B66
MAAGPQSRENHLLVQGVVKSFGTVPVLRGVSLAVGKGTTTAIVGPSGSGKTTLLRVIAGFEVPDAGSVLLNGQMVAGAAFVPAHRRNIGYVPQDGALFPHLSVAGNIAFGLSRKALKAGGLSLADRLLELFELVSLEPELAARRPDELSGGQQQRVALARALAREPDLLLLDEPFSALDAGLRTATRKAVAKTLARAGVTTVLVTHDQSEALSFADQVGVIRDGVVAQLGSPFVVYSRPVDLQTAEFLGDAVVLEAEVSDGLARCALGAIPVRRPSSQGKVLLMLRPEQIRIVDSGPVRGTILDTDYFGPMITARIRLQGSAGTDTGPATGPIISIRHWNALLARPGAEVFLEVAGEAVAFDPADGGPVTR